MKVLASLCAAATIFALPSIGQAASVAYSVNGWGPTQYPAGTTPPANAPWGVNGYPGDTIALEPLSGSLTLSPGTYTLPVNTLDWTIDYTYGGTATDPNAWTDQTFNIAAITRGISFAGNPAGSITQSGSLLANWDNDYLTLNAGSSATFVVSGYIVVVTPLALDTTGGSNFDGPNPWVQPQQTVYATFDVSPVPLPASVGTGLTLLAGLGSVVALRKHLARKSHAA
jgi:hypothetical protein